ncbi:DUF58 domain-containing protein [Microbacterium sp. P06]|uniref:DUF58 domain-containing protein n=1 Tax=Microbacterium sp. P06 TaxID=3366949 RepID=UPI0037459E9F
MIGFVRRVWPLTLRGTGALVLAALGFVVAHEAGLVELVYFSVLLLSVLVASVVSLWFTRRIDTVSRSLSPDVATVGRESVVTVRVGVRNALPMSPGAWDDTVSPGLDGRARGIFPAVGSGLRGSARAVDLRYTVEGRSRGIHSLGPFGLTTTDPFGLARRRIRLGGRTSVTVAPRVVELVPFVATAAETGGTRETATTQLGQGADNLVARPYAPGDSMRRIHWRATAHRDTLMVRQEEQDSSPEATVILDRGAAHWGPDALRAPGADAAFETAVSAAVSAVARLVRDGYTVEVIDTDGSTLSEPILGGEIHEIDALATQFATLVARQGNGVSRAAGLFAGAQTGPVVVITGHLRVADALALAPLAHHSSLAVLIATSPSSDALARLRDQGWHTASAFGEGDLADAWETARERGVNRVGA